jgi:hypothetical protein
VQPDVLENPYSDDDGSVVAYVARERVVSWRRHGAKRAARIGTKTSKQESIHVHNIAVSLVIRDSNDGIEENKRTERHAAGQPTGNPVLFCVSSVGRWDGNGGMGVEQEAVVGYCCSGIR